MQRVLDVALQLVDRLRADALPDVGVALQVVLRKESGRDDSKWTTLPCRHNDNSSLMALVESVEVRNSMRGHFVITSHHLVQVTVEPFPMGKEPTHSRDFPDRKKEMAVPTNGTARHVTRSMHPKAMDGVDIENTLR